MGALPSAWSSAFRPAEFQPVEPRRFNSYRLLPDHVREADTDGVLDAFLTGAEAALDPELRWLDACSRGEPVRPEHCPVAWLGWLGWLRGRDVRGLTTESARWLLSRTSRIGSDQGLADAVAATLTGTRYVRVDHPSLWVIEVVVVAGEVADVNLTQSVAQRSKPAGVSLTVVPTSAVTLATIDANYASLAAITATGKNLDELRFG